MRKMPAFLVLTLALLAALPAAALPTAEDRRVASEGRVRDFVHERGGYRVYLEHNDDTFWVPESLLGRYALRVGMEVRLGGYVRGGMIRVYELDRLGDRAERGNDVVVGIVERVNRADLRLKLRDDRGRIVDVDARGVGEERYRHLDLRDLRRGDRVTLRGRWERGTFYAFRIESIR